MFQLRDSLITDIPYVKEQFQLQGIKFNVNFIQKIHAPILRFTIFDRQRV